MKKMNIAIVYDWIDKRGGVERMLLTIHDMFPRAHWYTSVYDPQKATWAKNLHIIPSFMQSLPPFIKKNRILSLPFYPLAFSRFNLSPYDVVISVTSSFAKAIRVQDTSRTKHLSIVLTPPRYIWTHKESYFSPSIRTVLEKTVLDMLRAQDKRWAMNPHSIITISHHVKKRVIDIYNRKSIVIYPPFDFSYWSSIQKKLRNKRNVAPKKIRSLIKKDYYLCVGRLERYKRFDIAIDAVTKLRKTLAVVGTGSIERALKKKANASVIFLRDVSDLELGYLYTHAQALIMPQNEDFGYTAVEAQFFECPVISYKNSGVSEIIVANKTGVVFTRQSVKSCADAIERLESVYYNVKKELRKNKNIHLKKFRKSTFVRELTQAIKQL